MSGVAAAAVPTAINEIERLALLRKYRILAGWRRLRDAATSADGAGGQETAAVRAGEPASGATVPLSVDRAALRTLAREFPGALRELDVLGLPELLRRIERLSPVGGTSVAGPAADDRWMAWIAGYHALMRAALAIRRRGDRTRAVSDDDVAQARAALAPATAWHIDQTFLQAVLRPPAGRLGLVVMQGLAARFETAAAEISTTLFPPRRPPPYPWSP